MKKIRFAAAVVLLFTALTAAAFAKTTDIYSGDTVKMTLGAEKTQKYTFEVEEKNGYVKIELTELSSSSGKKPKLKVSLSDGSKVFSEFQTKRDDENAKYVIAEGLKKGTYSITVENTMLLESADYSLKLDFTERDYVELESNDDREHATQLTSGKNYIGGVNGEKEEDWFCFEMPFDGFASVWMSCKEAKIYTFFDESGTQLASVLLEPKNMAASEPDADPEIIEGAANDEAVKDKDEKAVQRRIGLSKGKYYVRVMNYEELTDPIYALNVSVRESDVFESEPNGTAKTADSIRLSKEYKGDLTEPDDEDFYKFVLTQKDKIKVSFTDSVTPGKHYSLYIKDSDGKTVYSQELCSTTEFSLELDAGTYYFQVICPADKYFSTLGYKFKISADLVHIVPEEGIDSDKTEPVEPDGEPEQKPEQEPECTTPVFEDVLPSDWFYNDVGNAVMYGLIEGMGDGVFEPYGNVTVAQALAVAARLHSGNSDNGASFDDSESKEWFDAYVKYALENGIIKEGDFDDFKRDITRGEIACIFANAVLSEKEKSDVVFSDVAEDYAYADSIYALYQAGIVKGDGNGCFRPNDSLTRAEMAAIAVRAQKTPINK